MPAKRSTGSSDEGSDYKKKRERNNLAVKKCREKSNVKAKETIERVDKLKEQNLKLEAKKKELKNQVQYFKDVLLKNVSTDVYEEEIQKILNEPESDSDSDDNV